VGMKPFHNIVRWFSGPQGVEDHHSGAAAISAGGADGEEG
jgi:hypothetical protein